jgi:tRNA (cmo5U34)-methyltransferase
MSRESAELAVLFDAGAGARDAVRRKLIPGFDSFYETGVELVARSLGPVPRPRVLDLGAGTGVFSASLAAIYPDARLHLVDMAPDMLDEARGRLAGRTLDVSFEVADFARCDLGGPWDAVISALAIHHLDDAAKRALFHRVHAALRPGGVFVNAEQVRGPTTGCEARCEAAWREAVRAAGVEDPDLDAARAGMAEARCATLVEQMSWLSEAGFEEVDCAWKLWRFAVYGGIRLR